MVFNPALAHHLKAIAIITTNTNLSSNNLKVLQQALKLYELAYQLHVDYVQQPLSLSGALWTKMTKALAPFDSFTIIVSSNFGEIHRVAGVRQFREI